MTYIQTVRPHQYPAKPKPPSKTEKTSASGLLTTAVPCHPTPKQNPLSQAMSCHAPKPLTAAERLKDQVFIIAGPLGDSDNSHAYDIWDKLQCFSASPNIIALPNPYPEVKALEAQNLPTALAIFRQTQDPNSPVVQQTYRTLRQELDKPWLKGKAINLIGYSAGGQMAITLGEKLAQDGLKVQTVSTLGSPIMRNNLPKSVEVNQFVSDQDGILAISKLNKIASCYTVPLLAAIHTYLPVYEKAPNLDNNDKVIHLDFRVKKHTKWTRYNVLKTMYSELLKNETERK